MQYNDYELIYMVKENEEVFDYLLEKYEPLFKKLSYSFYNKNINKGIDVEELMQNCRITLYYAINKYDEKKEVLFYSYLLMCLNGMLKSYYKKYIKRPEVLNIYNNNVDYLTVQDVYNDYIDYDLQNKIIDFKNSLSFIESCVFELWYNEFSYKDIAVLLEISAKRVDNILVKVRKKMEKNFLFYFTMI